MPLTEIAPQTTNILLDYDPCTKGADLKFSDTICETILWTFHTEQKDIKL